MEKSKQLELYIHIPFCKQKCKYCDFVSFAGCESQFDDYVDALCREISLTAPDYYDRSVVSVYIGGGTPSVLNSAQMTQVVETLNKAFSITGTHAKKKGLFLQKKIRPSVEFTIECNPGTVDREKLHTYRKLGINRLSIGLQSTEDADLKTLGRIHSYEDFTRTYELAREEGFDNINVDLMQAIPGQTLAGWKRTLAVLATWMPEHISAYSLIIEEGTEFQRLYEAGRLDLPDEDTEREIYHYTKEFLEKSGYHRYEISNYAKPGFECLHNCGYWKRTDYLGLGLHASSMIDNTRWKNTSDLQQYLLYFSGNKAIDLQIDGSREQMGFRNPAKEEQEVLSRTEQMEEYMFLGLRMTEGVSKRRFLELFGQDLEFTYRDVLPGLTDLGLITSGNDRIRLTDRGIDVSNTVLAEFLLQEA